MTITELFRTNQLDAAVERATAGVKSNPGDAETRCILAELLCFSGQWARADKQLLTVESLSTDAAAALGKLSAAGQGAADFLKNLDPAQRKEMQRLQWVREFRQLIRAAQWRHDFFQEGRVPEFPAAPNEEIQHRLEATIALRNSNPTRAAELLETAENSRNGMPVICNETPLEDFRDADDITASVIELLTPGGKYFWLPICELARMEFTASSGLRDALWRPVSFRLRSGMDGAGFVPAIYWHPEQTTLEPALRLGRAADWEEIAGGLFRGQGGRVYDGDGTTIPLMSLRVLDFEVPMAEEAEHE